MDLSRRRGNISYAHNVGKYSTSYETGFWFHCVSSTCGLSQVVRDTYGLFAHISQVSHNVIAPVPMKQAWNV